MNIVVAGYIIKGPLGGMSWHHLQYLMGLQSLGHDLLFVEDSDDYPSCYNPETFEITNDPTFGISFLKNLFSKFRINAKWGYFDSSTNKWFGLTKPAVLDFCKSAEVFINLSGIHPAREIFEKIPARIFVDTDPAFTQISNINNPLNSLKARWHSHHFSFGENFGKPDCFIPDDGFKWLPTRQPLYVPAWKNGQSTQDKPWTTVMQWDSYKEGELNGKKFGMKSLSFQPYFDLPQYLINEKLEIALGGANNPGSILKEKGWQIRNPYEISKTPWDYQNYISNSKGEWTVAKHGYVITKSGWFSERSLNYMASGKPVVVEDTGIKNVLPTGKGILLFSNIQEAIEQIKYANSDYYQHCRSAVEIAFECFSSDKILKNLLNRI